MTYTLQYTVITFFVGLYWSTHFLKPLFSLFVCRLILTLTLFCYPLISLYLSASPELQKKSSSNARLQVNHVQKNSCALLLPYKHPLFNMLFGLCTNLLALPTDSLIVLYCIQDFYLHNTHLLSTVLYILHFRPCSSDDLFRRTWLAHTMSTPCNSNRISLVHRSFVRGSGSLMQSRFCL